MENSEEQGRSGPLSQPSVGGFFKGIKSATEQLRSLAPGWSTASEEDTPYGGPIAPAIRKGLAEQFVNYKRFQWVLPLKQIYISDSDFISDGYLAGDDDGGLVAFRQTENAGVQVWAAPQTSAAATVSTVSKALRLRLAIKGVHGIRGMEAELHLGCLTKGCGEWWRLWEQPLRDLLGTDPTLVEIEICRAAHQRFGTHAKVFSTLAFAGIQNDRIVTAPEYELPTLSAVTKWGYVATHVEFLGPLNHLPHRVRIASRDESARGFLPRIQQALPQEPSVRCLEGSCDAHLATVGVFDGRNNLGDLVSPCVLQAAAGRVVQLHPTQPDPYTHCVRVGEVVVLANHAVGCVAIKTSPMAIDVMEQNTASLDGLVKGTRDGKPCLWTAAVLDDAPETPVYVEFLGNELRLGRDPPIALGESTLEVQGTSATGLYRLAFAHSGRSTRLRTTEAIAFGVWQEWDARRTAHGVSKATTAELYSQFNESKTNNFLLVLYGDIVLLNRSLNTGMSMSNLMTRLQEEGAASFAEDESLRDATIAKIMLLLAGLTPIKQKFELLATMTPYYWVGQEAKWIASVFGDSTATKLSSAERKRLVPVLRRHIRGMQGDILRSLSHVEAAARPLDAIFAREELQKHWSSWVKPFMSPFLAQSIATRVLPTAAAAMVGASSAAAVSTALLPVIASVGAVQAVSMVSGYFAKHREEGAQVRRAAQVIFPWWQVFMKTLAVSLYESREFVAEQNSVAMKRDKTLLDSCPPHARARVISTLNQQLRRRIVNEKRTRYGEMLEGTGVRMRDLIEDFQSAAGDGMRVSVGEFVASLPVGRSQKLLPEE
jgi:hypothetical protein